MLKGLKGHKMSRTNKVRAITFSVCCTRDIGNGRLSCVVFLDFKEAFDTIDNSII